MRWMISLFSVATVAFGAIASTTAPAKACGGFFCDSAQPVNQAAERIIFSRGADGKVTAVIQIMYEGPADRFAWMLPVVGVPDIAVSSNVAFTRLQQATNPTYRLFTSVEGSCRPMPPSDFGGGADSFTAADTTSASDSSNGVVTVVDEGSVGPYDYVVISVDSGSSMPASAAVEWLQDNGFDIDDLGAERIGPYLESGMNLLSFKLTKGNNAGSIRPVILGFGDGLASIPIRPTAVAAVDDMGVMVWVLGQHRAFPVNYASLELNEALINWFNPTTTYNAVVTEAANQAGGQGFVTEMSGPMGSIGETVFSASDDARWTEWRENPSLVATVPGFAEVVRAFGSFDGFVDAVSSHLTLPNNIDVATLLRCPECGWLVTDDKDVIRDFDVTGFIAAVEANVIAPMRATRALFNTVKITRLYTTMSASEMVLDPSFDVNPDLPDVSAARTASRIIECSEVLFQSEAPWRVELGDGQTVRGFGQSWPLTLANSGMPANARIRRVGQRGQGEVIVDNATVIGGDLAAHNAEVTRQAEALVASRGETGAPDTEADGGTSAGADVGTGGTGGTAAKGSGCGAGGTNPLAAGLFLSLAFMFGRRATRRRAAIRHG